MTRNAPAPLRTVKPTGRPKGGPPGHARFLGSFTRDIPAPGLPEVAFAGRSNVGKSSAINALLGVGGLARTSRTPGRTQALNFFEVGGRWIAVDLPGYGYAKVSHTARESWKRHIEDYLGERPTLKLVVVLVDARHPAQPMDQQLIESLVAAGIRVLVLATKVDAISRTKRQAALAALAAGHRLQPDMVLGFSSTESIGVEEARAAIDLAVRS